MQYSTAVYTAGKHTLPDFIQVRKNEWILKYPAWKSD